MYFETRLKFASTEAPCPPAGQTQEVSNQLKISLAENQAVANIENLKANLNAIISNVITGDENGVSNIVDILLANNAVIKTVTAELEAFAVNEVNGTGNDLETNQFYDILNNADLLQNLFLKLTGLSFNTITGSGNTVKADLKVIFGQKADMGIDGLVDAVDDNLATVNATLNAILVNELLAGRDNFLNNVLNIALWNGVDVDKIRTNVEAILVNKVMWLS